MSKEEDLEAIEDLDIFMSILGDQAAERAAKYKNPENVPKHIRDDQELCKKAKRVIRIAREAVEGKFITEPNNKEGE